MSNYDLTFRQCGVGGAVTVDVEFRRFVLRFLSLGSRQTEDKANYTIIIQSPALRPAIVTDARFVDSQETRKQKRKAIERVVLDRRTVHSMFCFSVYTWWVLEGRKQQTGLQTLY